MKRDRTGLSEVYPDAWRWLRIARRISGWLTDREGNALFELARHRVPEKDAVAVELGSWQGKSSVLLAAGLSGKHNPRLFCVDPFGKDENARYQAEFYDPLLANKSRNLEEIFQANIRRCGFAHIAEPVRGYSFDVVSTWREPIDLLFIDASHEYEAVHRDLLQWAPFVKVGGVVALHDVSPVWPGPSRVMAEDLQPPFFDDLEQADSLLWAVKRSSDTLPEKRRIVRITIPKSDFDVRQLEIAQLQADRKYLMDENARHRAAVAQLQESAAGDCRVKTAEARCTELEQELTAAAGARAAIQAELDRERHETAKLERRAEAAEQCSAKLEQQLAVAAAARSALHAELNEVRESLERAAETAERRRTDLEQQLTAAEGAHTELETELARISSLLAEARHANASLHSSWSWRITAPLRLMVDITGVLQGKRRSLGGSSRIRAALQWLYFRDEIRKSGIFDEVFYLEQYPDVRGGRIEPLLHYFLFGAAEARFPNFLFDTGYYLSQNRDVTASKLNPLAHYLKWGAYEGRRPHPDFDSSFYLAQNPDVKERRLNPLAHYLGPGTPEGRDPNQWFHTIAYLDANPYLAVAAIHPFKHYLARNHRGG